MAISRLGNSIQIPTAQTPEVKNEQEAKMLEAARGFENYFLRQIVSEMRKGDIGDGLVPNSMADNVFKEQLDSQYVDQWVDSGGVGFANMIFDYLKDMQSSQQKVKELRHDKYHAFNRKDLKAPVSYPAGEIFKSQDATKFEAKRMGKSFQIKSIGSLENPVEVHSPVDGVVTQSQRLDDGRSLISIKHDSGLVTKFVHDGNNNVKVSQQVSVGTKLFDLTSPQKTGPATMLFELHSTKSID